MQEKRRYHETSKSQMDCTFGSATRGISPRGEMVPGS